MKKIVTLLMLLALLLTACGGKATEAPLIPISDAAKNVEVAAGNEFKIVIESNPSTGYQWKMIGELDESIVQFVSRGYQSGSVDMPGAGGQDVWVFQAVAPGQTSVTLGYYPPSNEAVEPAQTVTFTIVVK